jgi:hypothetical protein
MLHIYKLLNYYIVVFSLIVRYIQFKPKGSHWAERVGNRDGISIMHIIPSRRQIGGGGGVQIKKTQGRATF